ncbi:hypothetical protein WME79_21705 [Sorangium sp. So ce726]|uniref:hypothetical protein n=1 Tax=Sorangium sp. So ce726 TaxID=3133319 RepID=UPI003F61EC72
MAKQRGQAETMRERLWTLLVRRYADLRKIGYCVHGDAFEEVTPKLRRAFKRPSRAIGGVLKRNFVSGRERTSRVREQSSEIERRSSSSVAMPEA